MEGQITGVLEKENHTDWAHEMNSQKMMKLDKP